MIISTACEQQLPEFKKLMHDTDLLLNQEAKRNQEYFVGRGGKKLEEDVYRALVKCAESTAFAGTINLVSGSSFPDIVANRMFGVEVKSTEKNRWQSIGSSILESTRDQNVERIYMTFGKLGKPVEFLSKPYEDCLSEIVVTHYPRYRIDMHLQENNEPTIFEKMNIDYDEIRKMDSPVPVVSKYYKAQLKQGESLWWAADSEQESAPMKARLWSALSHEEKDMCTIKGYVLFPEVLSGGSSKKYNRYALWLATTQGIVNTNIRDSFSAGGQVEMMTLGNVLVKMPAAFGRVKKFASDIKHFLADVDEAVLKEYWKQELSKNRLRQWCSLVSKYANSSVGYDLSLNVLSCIFPEAFCEPDAKDRYIF